MSDTKPVTLGALGTPAAATPVATPSTAAAASAAAVSSVAQRQIQIEPVVAAPQRPVWKTGDKFILRDVEFREILSYAAKHNSLPQALQHYGIPEIYHPHVIAALTRPQAEQLGAAGVAIVQPGMIPEDRRLQNDYHTEINNRDFEARIQRLYAGESYDTVFGDDEASNWKGLGVREYILAKEKLGFEPPRPKRDAAGRELTYETVDFRGLQQLVTKTHHDLSKEGKLVRFMYGAGRFIRAPFALLGWGLSKIGGSQNTQNTLLEKAQFWNETSLGTNYTGVVDLTAAKSKELYDCDITTIEGIKEEIELARGDGRLLRQDRHQYVLLNNGVAIIIPGGNVDKAHCRSFWNRDTGKSFENGDTHERVVRSFLKVYDALEKQGGLFDDTIIIDIDAKTVRGFHTRPDPNKPLDSLGSADKFYDVEDSTIESIRALFDPEKTESKGQLHGEKVEGNPRAKLKKEKEKAEREKNEAARAAAEPPKVRPYSGEKMPNNVVRLNGDFGVVKNERFHAWQIHRGMGIVNPENGFVYNPITRDLVGIINPKTKQTVEVVQMPDAPPASPRGDGRGAPMMYGGPFGSQSRSTATVAEIPNS